MGTKSDQIEGQLIGGMIRNGAGAVEIIGHICEEDFRRDDHRRIYRAIANLVESRAPIELVTVAKELTRLGWLEDVGGYTGLADVFEAEPTGANLEYYARKTREAAILRQLGNAGRQIVTLVDEPGKSAEEIIDESERLVFAVSEQRLPQADDERHVREVVHEVYDRIDERAQYGSGVSGVTTGLLNLDLITAGLQSSELTIIAARPSVGKTTVGMAFAVNAAIAGVPTLVVSLEMSRADLVERMLCAMSGVDSQRLRQSGMTATEQRAYQIAGNQLRTAPLVISDQPSQRATRIASRARRRKARGELGLLVIDYLQLIEPENRRDPRHEQVAQISRRLKLLARELKIPVVVLAQLNREVENRSDRRPRLSDLRESGSLEQDADVVMLLHRPEDRRDDLEVIVAKNRNGPTGEVILRHHRSTGRISDPIDGPFGG